MKKFFCFEKADSVSMKPIAQTVNSVMTQVERTGSARQTIHIGSALALSLSVREPREYKLTGKGLKAIQRPF